MEWEGSQLFLRRKADYSPLFLLGDYCCSFKRRVYSQLLFSGLLRKQSEGGAWLKHTRRPLVNLIYYSVPRPTSVPSCPPLPHFFLKKKWKHMPVWWQQEFSLLHSRQRFLDVHNCTVGLFLSYCFGLPIFKGQVSPSNCAKLLHYWINLPEKAIAPHSSTLAWKIPWMEEPGRLQCMGSLRVRHDWATSLSFSLFTFMHWRRKWQPTPVFLPGESQGRGSLVGCCLWGRTESDTTELTYIKIVPRIFTFGNLKC